MTSGPIDSIRTCETEDANVCYESHGRDGQNRNILYKIFWLYLVGKAGPLRAAAWLMTWATFTLSWTTVNLLECSTGRVMPINNKTSRSLDAVARMQRFERYFPEMLKQRHLLTKLKITFIKTYMTDWLNDDWATTRDVDACKTCLSGHFVLILSVSATRTTTERTNGLMDAGNSHQTQHSPFNKAGQS